MGSTPIQLAFEDRRSRNAARAIEGNPALMNLRILQAISQGQSVPGTTRFVVNLADGQAPDA